MIQHYLIEDTNLIIASTLVLALGAFLNKRFSFLSRFNIPVAVSGGLSCSLMLTICYVGFDIQVDFDMALRDLLLLTFFSTIGLSAKLNTLVAGGKTLVILLGFSILLLIVQDTIGVGLALLMDAHPAYGLFAGSISFAGGHGTAIAWGDTAEAYGLSGAANIGIVCATFGLVAGSIFGGPVGGFLVNRYKLAKPSEDIVEYEVIEETTIDNHSKNSLESAFSTLLLLALCVGLGNNINDWLSSSGVSLPPFLTAMFVGIVLTNLSDVLKMNFNAAAVNHAGEVSLHLFLAMSLMSVPLWQLANLMGPLIFILTAQILIITLLAVYFVFRFTGKDYDAAVIASGFMGLGLGATPVAMANMQVMTSKYGISTKAFIVVPLVGAFFIDLSNAIIIKTFFSLPLLQQGLSIPG